ncbi:MAG: hypothetical protein JST68_02645 [Bacteroidetes bacterium]|nr:hypothetical protein [Bacteroidota bacterium]
MVKNLLLVIIILLLAIVGLLLLRHPPAPPLSPGTGIRPPAAGLPAPPDDGPHPPHPGTPENLKTRRGLVLGYQNNAHLDVNAIRLKTPDEGAITIDFRPHTARTIMNLAPIGDSIEVVTGSRPNDEYIVYQLHRIENLHTHRQADLDALPPPPDVPMNYTAEDFTLHNPRLLTDPYGGLDAIRSDKLLFHFKPGLVDDIAGLIKSAKTITLGAVRRSEDFGFVNIDHDTVYIVLSVTIEHKTFLVR